MGLKNCKACGTLFAAENDICEKCQKVEDQKYRTIRDFLVENPGADVSRIAEHTGLSVSDITNMIKRGSIQASD